MSAAQTQVLVIGSGAGGALTAAVLAENGREVTVVEEGPWIDPDAYEPFTLEEMRLKYRYRGLSATLGRPPIAFVEGRCVGGGTEINSGLFHRPPPTILQEWRDRFGIDECGPDAMDGYLDEIERTLSVSRLPSPPPSTSAVLERGASKLGWQAMEVPRVFHYGSEAGARGVKQTMTRTYIPRAVAAGATVLPRCRVQRLIKRGRRVEGAVCVVEREHGRKEKISVLADHVFVCAGAIETPALLQRSGILRNIGRALKVHPTIKVAARFSEPLDGHDDVPMHQVKEFSPELTMGGAVSRKGYVALALSDNEWNSARMRDWENIGVYYASIRSQGSGRVVALPGTDGALVTYALTESDLSRLARGLVHLAEMLFAAGAVELYPSIAGAPSLRSPEDLGALWDLVVRPRLRLMTIHLSSSVRMGEDRSQTGADSFGLVWGFENLRVNDASLIPDAPGVNPQGTIMALAARNCDRFMAAS